MTIAAGFKCREGFLLASDTLYADTNQRHGRKLWAIVAGDNHVWFAGAGTHAGLERVRHEIATTLTASMNEREIAKCVEDALAVTLEDVTKDPAESTDALFVIRCGPAGPIHFLENRRGSELSAIGTAAQCVGSASSLGKYYLDVLYRELMPIRWARIVAAHLVAQAKAYSASCGGDTTFLEVRRDGTTRFIDDQLDIAADAQHLGQLDAAMRAVLPDASVSDDALEQRLRTIVEAIQRQQL